MTRAFRTLLILSHRYIGIPLSFMFVVWFVSAFFMIYTGGMPRLTPDMRADGSPAIDFSRVRLSPGEAAALADYPPDLASMRTILGRPFYQFGESGYAPQFVAADTGEILAALTPEQGARLAGEFLDLPTGQFSYQGTLREPDQWTLTSMRQLPLYKYRVDDGLGTEVYVSPENALVSVYTTRQSRALAWLGTIPHWLYFEGLRNNQPLWYKLVVYLSYAGCVLALLGLALAVVQWRKTRPFRLRQAIPYRGLMRWHYILGGLFGVFTLTWVFSGLVSMEPWGWTNAGGLRVSPTTYRDQALALEEFDSPATLDWAAKTPYPVKELEFSRVLGEPYLLATYSVPRDADSDKRDRLHQPYNINGQSSASTLVLSAASGEIQQRFPLQRLVDELQASVAGASVTDYALLEQYDDYYYSRQGQLKLPVLRVRFDDPAESWIYVDPQRGKLLSLIHKYSRIERWLYSGLHSLDFAFWYHKRPLWDLGVILLLCGGLATSVLGLYAGLRRLRGDCAQLLRRLKTAGAVRKQPDTAAR